MEKKKIFKAMAKGDLDRIISLGNRIKESEEIEVIKKPQKTLVMVKMKDTVSNSPYYLGEVLACESYVLVNGVKGMAVTMGDNFNLVLNMAIIDGALNAKLDEKYEITKVLENELKEIDRKERLEFSRTNSTKVDFSVMEG